MAIEPITMFLISQALSAGIGALGDVAGGQAQSSALSSAQQASLSEARKQRHQQQQMLKYMRQMMSEGAPTRQQQYGATQFGLQGLQRQATAAPGTSQSYQLASENMMRNLSQNLSRYGVSPDSSVFARSSGVGEANLMAADQERINVILQYLAGQSPNTLPMAGQFGELAQGYGGQAGQQISNYANLLTSQGAVKGGMASSLGDRFGGALNNYAMMNMMLDPRFAALFK